MSFGNNPFVDVERAVRASLNFLGVSIFRVRPINTPALPHE